MSFTKTGRLGQGSSSARPSLEEFKNLGITRRKSSEILETGDNEHLIAEKIPSWSWSWQPMGGGKVQLQWFPPVGGAWIGCSCNIEKMLDHERVAIEEKREDPTLRLSFPRLCTLGLMPTKKLGSPRSFGWGLT